MSLLQLREHRDHRFGEHHDHCGYCWLEQEANAGEYQGCGYTQEEVWASHEAALAPRDIELGGDVVLRFRSACTTYRSVIPSGSTHGVTRTTASL